MPAQTSTLRNFIKSALSEDLGQADVYGDYLFGEDRPDVFEKDTHSEKTLLKKFKESFRTNSFPLSQDDIDSLDMLRRSGKYNDMLDVPMRYKKAWRLIGINSKEHPELSLGAEETHIASDNTSLTLPLTSFSGTVAWTVDPRAIERMITDFSWSGHDVLVIFSCDLSSQRNKFMLNPDKFDSINPEYAYQKEIWQIDDVVTSKITSARIRWMFFQGPKTPKRISKFVKMSKRAHR